jgi:hypothetical protein
MISAWFWDGLDMVWGWFGAKTWSSWEIIAFPSDQVWKKKQVPPKILILSCSVFRTSGLDFGGFPADTFGRFLI